VFLRQSNRCSIKEGGRGDCAQLLTKQKQEVKQESLCGGKKKMAFQKCVVRHDIDLRASFDRRRTSLLAFHGSDRRVDEVLQRPDLRSHPLTVIR
jgi:hypothetical protein